MNELRRDGRALLEDARRERTPDAATRERVYQALLASPALASGAPAPATGKQPLTGPRKWLLLAALAAAIGTALYLAEHAGRKSNVATPHAPLRVRDGTGTGAPSR